MALDVVHPIFQVAVAFCKVDLEQVAKEVFQIAAKVGREAYLKHQKIRINVNGGTKNVLRSQHIVGPLKA